MIAAQPSLLKGPIVTVNYTHSHNVLGSPIIASRGKWCNIKPVAVFSDYAMVDKKKQCVRVKFCLILGSTAAEIGTVLSEAFEERAFNQVRVCNRFSHFKHGNIFLGDQLWLGHSSASGTRENV